MGRWERSMHVPHVLPADISSARRSYECRHVQTHCTNPRCGEITWRDVRDRWDRAMHVSRVVPFDIPSRNRRNEGVIVSGAVADAFYKPEVWSNTLERWEGQTGTCDTRSTFCSSRHTIFEQQVRVRDCTWCRCRRIA
jgi:hypothetical protein